MARHLTLAELNDGLPKILRSPGDEGMLMGIVIRPEQGGRRELSLAQGTHGDRWARAGGPPLPDIQICIMNARCIALIAGERANWAPAGDNLFIDLDLSPVNCPSGTRLAIGTAVIEITDGCRKFIARYGRDACVFVNTGEGKRLRLRLRGMYGRVVQDVRVSVGDVVRKLVNMHRARELFQVGVSGRERCLCY